MDKYAIDIDFGSFLKHLDLKGMSIVQELICPYWIHGLNLIYKPNIDADLFYNLLDIDATTRNHEEDPIIKLYKEKKDSGVYMMLEETEYKDWYHVLYVGKSGFLNTRLNQHFNRKPSSALQYYDDCIDTAFWPEISYPMIIMVAIWLELDSTKMSFLELEKIAKYKPYFNNEGEYKQKLKRCYSNKIDNYSDVNFDNWLNDTGSRPV